jgi:hypothetical protein
MPISILDLCKQGDIQIDPVSIRAIFLLLTRNHFASSDNFGGVPQSFKKFVYSDDPMKRSLHVELDYIYDEQDTEKRPVIFVGCENFMFSKEVIDNYLDSKVDLAGQEFYNVVATRLKFRHLALTADEALMLGTLTTSFYLGIRAVLQEAMRLKKFEVLSLSPPHLVKHSADKQFLCDLSIDVVYQNTWETNAESHRIKKISFDPPL